ncbi:MAG: hypothetical protein ABEJ04_01650 [Halobacteriaceae archaeon]
MAEPPELWTFVVTNLFVFGFGSVLTVLSFLVYWKRGHRTAFRDATVGFACVTASGLVAPVYQLFIRQGYDLDGRELLTVQTVEGAFLALGLGVLFYSIYRYQ